MCGTPFSTARGKRTPETSDEIEYDELPLVDSCSGCSSAAQLANDLAVSLDRDGVAETSCIAGGVAPLVETATSGRPIVAIDGCPLECTKRCLEGTA